MPADLEDVRQIKAQRLAEDANKLKALWRRGRDMFTSFFVELQAAHDEIGDAGLDDWRRQELGMPLKAIALAAKLLPVSEAENVAGGSPPPSITGAEYTRVTSSRSLGRRTRRSREAPLLAWDAVPF